MNSSLYSVKPTREGDYMVVNNRKVVAAFFGTKEDCEAWLEREGKLLAKVGSER